MQHSTARPARPPSPSLRSAALALAALAALAAAPAPAQEAAVESPGGRHHRVHALVGGRVVTRPGQAPEVATIVVRDGVVAAVGSDVVAPPDARVWDARGLVVYAGLVEPYLVVDDPAPAPGRGGRRQVPEPTAGPAGGDRHPNARVRPERVVADDLLLPPARRAALREAGFTVALAVPGRGVLRGRSALVALGEGDLAAQVIERDVALHLAFERAGWGSAEYPSSLMGAAALIRQTLLDAEHHAAAWTHYRARSAGSDRPASSAALDALAAHLAAGRPIAVEVDDAQTALLAGRLLRERGLAPWLVLGASDAWRWLEPLRDLGLPVVACVNFPPPPAFEDDDEADRIPLAELRRWWLAPEDPGRLEAAGVRFAVTAHGLPEPGLVLDRLRAAIARGLSPDAALAALTTAPAALLGAPRLGVIAPGCAANLTVCDGPLFDRGTRVVEVWVDGARHAPVAGPPGPEALAGRWALSLGPWRELTVTLAARAGELTARFGPAPSAAPAPEPGEGPAAPGAGEAGPEPPTPVELWRDRVAFRVPGARAGLPGDALVTARVEGGRLRGRWTLALPAGEELPPAPGSGADAEREVEGRKLPGAGGRGGRRGGAPDPGGDDEGGGPPPSPGVPIGPAAPWPPAPPPAPAALLVRDAVVWTLGPRGTLRGDVLTRDGRIVAVGAGLEAPPDAEVVQARGRHVTPGLIDCHGHAFIRGGVNEATRSCTAEVRVADVLDAETVDLYRQLAGGVTAVNLLHGSANAIGGQSAVVAPRWGEPPERLLIAEAAPGIKWALGENPKRANWGDDLPPRYPSSRAGVLEAIRERLLAARDYRARLAAWEQGGRAGPPVRRDLELEALVEVLEGRRQVHCHAYRQDEILGLVRLADELGFTIGTFQHVLEGYKVARELAAHGAHASTFADWWAYKFEVYDAIAHNAALMHRRGVLVSLNSDSAAVARHLHREAAKTVRWGGLDEEEALALVTRNPALQLGLGARQGTLEPGKQADLVLWSSHPLGPEAVCEATWIGGRRHFDREADAAARPAVEAERAGLLRAARAARGRPEQPRAEGWAPSFGRPAAAAGDHDHERGLCGAEEHP